MTQAQIKEAGLENVTLERDFTFGIKDADSAKAAEPEVAAAPAKAVAVDLDLLSVSAPLLSTPCLIGRSGLTGTRASKPQLRSQSSSRGTSTSTAPPS